METIRKFEHDGNTFEIKTGLDNGTWRFRVHCDGKPLGEEATVDNETRGELQQSGHGSAEEIVADELERLVRAVYDLRVEPL